MPRKYRSVRQSHVENLDYVSTGRYYPQEDSRDPRPTPLDNDRAVRRFLEKQLNSIGGSPIKNSIECGRLEKASAAMIKKGLKRLK